MVINLIKLVASYVIVLVSLLTRLYEESLRPLSWSTIGVMGVRDSSWDRQVGEDDAVAAVDDFGDVDLVSRA